MCACAAWEAGGGVARVEVCTAGPFAVALPSDPRDPLLLQLLLQQLQLRTHRRRLSPVALPSRLLRAGEGGLLSLLQLLLQ